MAQFDFFPAAVAWRGPECAVSRGRLRATVRVDDLVAIPCQPGVDERGCRHMTIFIAGAFLAA